MYYENMMGMHALWWIFWVVIVLSFVVWGRDERDTRRNKSRETPHEILRRRLGSGELTTEEYEKRKSLLDRDS